MGRYIGLSGSTRRKRPGGFNARASARAASEPRCGSGDEPPGLAHAFGAAASPNTGETKHSPAASPARPQPLQNVTCKKLRDRGAHPAVPRETRCGHVIISPKFGRDGRKLRNAPKAPPHPCRLAARLLPHPSYPPHCCSCCSLSTARHLPHPRRRLICLGPRQFPARRKAPPRGNRIERGRGALAPAIEKLTFDSESALNGYNDRGCASPSWHP
jgi:hypothetical protein